jgi:outer membrane protein assembly factor BamB
MEVTEDRIFINASSRVVALDKATGTMIWETDFTHTGTGHANLVYLDGYVYHVRNRWFVTMDAQTGEIVYEERPRDGTYFWHVAASSDKVFAQTSGHVYAYEPWQGE